MSEERRIEYMRIDTLVPALRNPRTHDLDVLRESMGRFGYTVPAVMDERTGRLVAGHGRTQSLQIQMGAGADLPAGIEADNDGVWCTPVVRGWASKDDAEAAACLVADNRLTEIAGWHDERLLDGLQRLATGPGLAGVGYDTDDIDDLLAKLQETAPDIVMPPLDPPPNERHTGVRSFVLDYPLAEYEYVARVAHRARWHFGVDSNAELFEAMLKAREEQA